MRKALFFVAALAALLALSVAAQAHTEDQLGEWQDDWTQRIEAFIEAHGVLSVDLMTERQDWFERHPCSRTLGTYTDAECRPAETHTRVKASPANTPPTPSASTGMGTNVEQWRGLVSATFGKYTDEALRVIRCESGGNPNAQNPSGASGLFQVMPMWQSKFGGSLFDPSNNVRIAKILFDDGNSRGWRWSHWVCQP